MVHRCRRRCPLPPSPSNQKRTIQVAATSLLLMLMLMRPALSFVAKQTPSSSCSRASHRALDLIRSSHRRLVSLSLNLSNMSKRPLPSNDEADSEHISSSRKPMVIVIAGPTGVGKSSVAMSLCQPPNASRLLSAGGFPPSSNAIGNIVSADSVQAYRGVQVGANKPTVEEREECPHHLIDVVGAEDLTYNAADWMRDANIAIEELYGKGPNDTDDDGSASLVEETVLESRRLRRERIREGIGQVRTKQHVSSDEPILPIVVGGTMMYLQWLVHGRPDAMRPTDEALEKAAADIKRFQEMDGGEYDSAGNAKTDSSDSEEDGKAEASADSSPGWKAAVEYTSSLGKPFKTRVDKLCGKDWYRLRRILEVSYTVGAEKATEEQLEAVYSGERFGGLETKGYDVRCFFLCPDNRLQHAEVIDRRCEDMLQRGLLSETADLSVAGELPDNGQPARAIGYRQTLDYLRRRDAKGNDTAAFNAYVDEFTTATRRYAKKQMGWFRKDGEFMFIPVSISKPSKERVEEVVDHILHFCMLSRKEYENELFSDPPKSEKDSHGNKAKRTKEVIDPDTLTLSARTKQQNEKQGKEMKFYMGGVRYQILQGTPQQESVLKEADTSTVKIQGLTEHLFSV